MREATRLAAVVAGALLVCACGKASPNTLVVGTYNAGLAPGYVPYAAERAPEVVSGLAAQDLDVLCVQEVWRPEDVAALEAGTKGSWPTAFFLAPNPGDTGGDEPACTGTELDPLQACAEAECAGVPVDQIAGCVLDKCPDEFAAISSGCSTCLAAHIGASFADIRLACTTGSGGAYAFGGSFGVGLLTRERVVTQAVHVFESTYNRRAVLYARLDTAGLGQVDVFCTHLSAIFSNIPYPKEGSWAEEQRAQIDKLHAFVQEKTGGKGTTLVLGDTNCGPAKGGASAEAPENYQALVAPDYDDPFATSANAACTFCSDNPLVGAGTPSVLIDHVLVRGFDGGVTTQRILDGKVAIDVGGEPVETPRSDHYGLEATLSR